MEQDQQKYITPESFQKVLGRVSGDTSNLHYWQKVGRQLRISFRPKDNCRDYVPEVHFQEVDSSVDLIFGDECHGGFQIRCSRVTEAGEEFIWLQIAGEVEDSGYASVINSSPEGFNQVIYLPGLHKWGNALSYLYEVAKGTDGFGIDSFLETLQTGCESCEGGQLILGTVIPHIWYMKDQLQLLGRALGYHIDPYFGWCLGVGTEEGTIRMIPADVMFEQIVPVTFPFRDALCLDYLRCPGSSRDVNLPRFSSKHKMKEGEPPDLLDAASLVWFHPNSEGVESGRCLTTVYFLEQLRADIQRWSNDKSSILLDGVCESYERSERAKIQFKVTACMDAVLEFEVMHTDFRVIILAEDEHPNSSNRVINVKSKGVWDSPLIEARTEGEREAIKNFIELLGIEAEKMTEEQMSRFLLYLGLRTIPGLSIADEKLYIGPEESLTCAYCENPLHDAIVINGVVVSGGKCPDCGAAY